MSFWDLRDGDMARLTTSVDLVVHGSGEEAAIIYREVAVIIKAAAATFA